MDGAPTEAIIEVPAHAGAHQEEASIVLKPDLTLVAWTWVTFAIVVVVLYKVAWKPILAGLDAREENIRGSIDKADEINRKLDEIKATQDSLIAEADHKAKEIVDHARVAATEAAQVVQRGAKEEAKILYENAEREIAAAQAKAQSVLRRESAELAVGLARKVLQEKLDAKQDAKLVDRLVSEV